MEIILKMFFLILCNTNIKFDIKKLTYMTYTITKALPITTWIQLIDNKEFPKTAQDAYSETFVVYV